MSNLRVPTSKLHPYVRLLIKEMREGTGQWRGQTEDAPGGFNAPTKPKRYAPREVVVRFVPNAHVKVNVAGFNIHAVHGQEISRDGECSTWMGSDGEPNYNQFVTFHGPVVGHYGYGKRAFVELAIPTGLSDEYQGGTTEPPFRLFLKCALPKLEAGDTDLLTVLIDAAVEGTAAPFRAMASQERWAAHESR